MEGFEEGTSRGQVEILGIPMDLGQDRRGVDMGPSALRYARLQDTLQELGYDVADGGNLSVPIPEVIGEQEEVKRLGIIQEVCTEASKRAAGILERGAFPVFLGGDHSISIGTIAGVASVGRTGVLWLDAHADFNTPETSPTGNVHGMPLAVLIGLGHPDLTGIGGAEPSIRAQDVVLVGLRSIDPQERKLLLEAGVTVYTIKDVDTFGVATIVRRALADLSHLSRVHLSLDLDVVDPEAAPGVGTPVRGGLTYREAHLLMEMISDSGAVTSLDVVEVNPILDVRNQTATLAVELVGSLMGHQIISLLR